MTDRGKKLAEALTEADPSEWWDVMIGSREVENDGTAKEKEQRRE